MGYYRETVEVALTDIRDADTFDDYSAKSDRRNSLGRRIVNAAIANREMEDYDRNGTPEITVISILDITPVELYESSLAKVEIDHIERRMKRRSDLATVVPIMDTRDYKVFKKTVKVTLNEQEWLSYLNGGQLWDKVHELVPGEDISCYRIVREDSPLIDRTTGWKVNSSVDVDTSGGKATTVYQLKINGTVNPAQEYATIALARAAGVKMMEENIAITSVEVVGFVRREDKSSMVKMKRAIRSATAQVEVEYVRLTNREPRYTSYMVSYWCRD